jgi:hypothetical protein
MNRRLSARRWGPKAIGTLILAIAGTLAQIAATAAPAGASPGLVVSDLNHGVSAQDLANTLAGAGVTVSGVTYSGSNNAAGRFSGGNVIIGFDSGIILGSGSVQTTVDPHDPCSKGVEGPNECDGNTTQNGTAGDVQLDALSGFPTFDAAVLEFDFVPQFSTVQFSYVFSSDEYNEFVNTSFNDVFGFFVNGTNCATVGDPPQPVSINTINGGNPFGTNATNPGLYRNNDPDDPGPPTIDTEMDGLTVVLTCNADVNAGVTNHMKLAIADASDEALDSNVFLQAGSLVSGTQVSTSLAGGGQSGATITVPSGTPVTDSATLSGANSATAGGTVTYTVFSDPACSTVFANAGTKTVSNGNVPDSDPVTFNQAGTFYWQAAYSGDPLNEPGSSPCGSETVTVTEGVPATLVLSPKTAENTVGQEHCVTATVTDAGGTPTPDITVVFSVSGANSASGSPTTDANGEAQFCYTGTTAGTDTISAFADTNTNGTQDTDEPGDTATKTYVLPPSTPGCKVTGGGQIIATNGDAATFGGNAQVGPTGAGVKGEEQFTDPGPATTLEVHSISIQTVLCSADKTQASIFGTATINGAGSFDFRIDVKDLGQPGRNDTYRIRLSDGYDSGEQKLTGGNIKIH